jgi:2-keto-3-deoxy-L-rhamnonate aldolase RhmA
MATRPAQFGALARDTHVRTSNDETLLIVTLETREALRNVHQIAGVPGVDLIFIGRDDLSESLNEPGNRDAASVDDAIREIVAAAGDTPVGTTAFKADDVKRFCALGVRFFLTGTSANIRMAFEQNRAALLTGLNG